MKNPICEYMKTHQLSKKEFAHKCNITVYILNKVIERKGGKASHLVKICKASNLKADDILGIANKTKK